MYGLEMMKVQQVFIWVGLATNLLTLDHYENLYCQIVGSKTFHLVPPIEYACLKGSPICKPISFLLEQSFPSAKWVPSKEDPAHFTLNPQDSTTPWLTVDPSKSTALESSDVIQECKPLVVTLQPGEVLYLPALWFHSVSQTSNKHGICIAVNYWYNMDFSCPLYSMFNFLRKITMIEDGRSKEIEFDKD
jgi:peptidyl-lysine (3S)-dioxygenase / protease